MIRVGVIGIGSDFACDGGALDVRDLGGARVERIFVQLSVVLSRASHRSHKSHLYSTKSLGSYGVAATKFGPVSMQDQFTICDPQ